MNNKFRGKWFFLIPIFALAAIALFGFLIMTLWNSVLVAVLHVGVVTFWQALGILLLSKMLFGGFRGGHWGRNRFKQKMQGRFMDMTPEERDAFKQQWGSRCGRAAKPASSESKAEESAQ